MTAVDALDILVQATRAASVALLAILAMRPVARRMLGPRHCYALWWIAPLAIAVAFVPHSPQLLGVSTATIDIAALGSAARSEATPPPQSAGWIVMAWACGALYMGWLLLRRQRDFERGLGDLRPRGGALMGDGSTALPAVLGVLRPRVILPRDFAERFTRSERHLILLHERTHIRRGDLYANAAIALARCLFWFHPLVHFAGARMRHDQELACDAIVIARHPNSRRTYGEAMLKTLAHARLAPLGVHWGIPHPIKERIQMLIQPVAPRRSRRIAGGLLLGTLGLATAFATWATANTATATSDTFTAKVSLAFANGAHKDLSLRHRLGKPFTVKSDEGGPMFALIGTVTRTPEGKYDLRAEMRQDDAVIASPHVVTSAGKAASIRVGDKNADGDFHGTTVAITLDAN